MKNPVVTIEMENGDIMKAELYPEIAPNTVNNFTFVKRAENSNTCDCERSRFNNCA